MATDGNPLLQVYHLPSLDRGLSTTMTPRTMSARTDGPLFRNMWNYVYLRGSLGAHFGTKLIQEFENEGYPTISQNGGYFETTPNGLLNGQCAAYIFADYPRTYNNSSSAEQSDFGAPMMILVTSREIHIYSPQDQTWYNATPVYTGESGAGTETVNVSGGGAVTVSTGTSSWATRKITPGQLIQFSGDANWYSIATVSSGPDTLTLYNYSGGVKAGVTYSIRRCFGGREYAHGDNLIYGQVFNGNLFLAGRTLAGATVGPAVIKVSNIYDNVYTTDYILAGFDLTGGMTADGQVIEDLWDIKGLQILSDGRVVVATSEVPSGRTGVVGNRIRYSSNDEAYQWVTSPGGFSDVVGTPGEINALGALDPNTVTIHFDRGIHVGQFTGMDDPPLNITKSTASVGCFAAKTLAPHRGGELYVGADGNMHRFDGDKSETISDQSFWLLATTADWSDRYSFGTVGSRNVAALAPCMVGLYDPCHNIYRVFVNTTNFQGAVSPPASYEDYEQECYCYVLNLNSGALFREHYYPQVTAASWPLYGFGTESSDASNEDAGDFGAVAIGSGTVFPNGTDRNSPNELYLMSLSAEGSIDPQELSPFGIRYWNSDESNDPGGFVTDDFDLGLPGVDKTLDHVVIWLSRAPVIGSAGNFTVDASPDRGQTWITATLATADPLTDQMQVAFYSPRAAESWRFRLKQDLANAASTEPSPISITRVSVYYQTQGEKEAVDPAVVSQT